jgi:hypothetical protein
MVNKFKMEPNDQSRLNTTPPLIQPPIPVKSAQRPNQASRVILFLLLGLAPTPIALASIATFASKKLDDNAALFLLVVDVVLSFAGAFGIVGSFTSKKGLRLLLAFALGVSFFALNAAVSFFTGCLLLISK